MATPATTRSTSCADPTNVSHVGSVDGGEGNDIISVTAMQVDSVAGGAGDDTITIQTLPELDNFDPANFAPVTPVEIRAGSGNDLVFSDRAANVYFGLGDGRDTMSLTNGGKRDPFGRHRDRSSMQMQRSDSQLQITWSNGDALILDIGTEDQMNVSLEDNIISITPIITPGRRPRRPGAASTELCSSSEPALTSGTARGTIDQPENARGSVMHHPYLRIG